MKNKSIVNKAILLLYEGETEEEFYRKLLEVKVPNRIIKVSQANLHGVFNLTGKVESKINGYLTHKNSKPYDNIYVVVAYDRDGESHVPSSLDLKKLKKEFGGAKSRIKGIYEVVATQDLESWFYHDMEGLHKYLRVPTAERKPKTHPNVEKVNHIHLSALFHRYKKQYQKGRRCAGLIDALDITKIVSKVPDLQEMINLISNLEHKLGG